MIIAARTGAITVAAITGATIAAVTIAVAITAADIPPQGGPAPKIHCARTACPLSGRFAFMASRSPGVRNASQCL